MTRRERLERKLERRRDWAAAREADAASRFKTAHSIVEHIPFGQPILVGHHSEKRHRAALSRHDANMSKGCESASMAEHHEQKAAGLKTQLERSIFSDDPDAIEALEAKVEALEAERDRMKAINKAIRSGEGWESRMQPPLTDGERKELSDLARCWGGVYKKGFPPYALTNLGGNIRRAKERIEIVKRRQARTEQAEQSAGGVVIEGGDWVRVTFAEKPSRDVLNALRDAGFRWGGGSWTGQRVNLPACVVAMVAEAAR